MSGGVTWGNDFALCFCSVIALGLGLLLVTCVVARVGRGCITGGERGAVHHPWWGKGCSRSPLGLHIPTDPCPLRALKDPIRENNNTPPPPCLSDARH